MSGQSVGALVAGAALLAALSGCGAQPTGYERRPSGLGVYGYSDQRVGDDEYTVVAHGDHLTSRERVARIALLRAAHLTIAEGRSRFAVLTQKSELVNLRYSQSILIFAAGNFLPIPVHEAQTQEPDAVLLIRLLPTGATHGAGAIDAAEVVKSLEPEFRNK
jgi:hypothetical protein